jgi:oligopeptidase B
MLKKLMPAIVIAALTMASCNNQTKNNETVMTKTEYKWPDSVKPPIAEKIAHELTAFGDIRIDNYYWMDAYFKKTADSTKVVDYLNAENVYYDTMMSGTKTLQENLYSVFVITVSLFFV